MKNPELDLAYQFVQLTNRNIFLTGKAGTGKTTFLKSLKDRLNKRMVVCAPTGVAAINAGGVTLHSFFQLPFGPIITERAAGHKVDNPNFKQKFNKQKINIIRTLELLIIDEISMVRADMLDAVDEVMRRYKNRMLPFGGVQLLMIGDIQQLSPVVTRADEELLYRYYPSAYFFHSKALKEAKPLTLELKHVYRQSDDAFIQILNEVRDNRLSPESYQKLHERYIPGFNPDNEEGYINLTTHNRTADAVNAEKLAQLDTEEKTFEASIYGTFPEHAYPTDYHLTLKVGAQVMFIKNDTEFPKRYYNGKIGIITAFDGNNIMVQCEGDDEPISTQHEIWENLRYSIDTETKAIKEDFIGSFTQYPLRLAWAVTIHKSQGLTFEKAVIDAADAFAHGQTYVALSRCKTLEGLVLSSKISESAIICDREVTDFNEENRKNPPDEKTLNESVHLYQRELLEELFNFRQVNYQFRKLNDVLQDKDNRYSGSLGETVSALNKTVLPELLRVSETFTKQIGQILRENPDAEHNTALAERLKKAAAYFTEFIREKIENSLDEAGFDTDNQAVEKAVKERLKNIREMWHVKTECLSSIANGFNTKEYLETRAKALLETPKKSKTKLETKSAETRYPALYERLKAWRKGIAEAEEIAIYRVLPNKSLEEIANRLPASEGQMLKVNGIGKKKAKLYSADLIEIVETFCAEQNLEADRSTPPPKKKKVKKKPNKVISFELYQSGKSIEEIAEAQGFVISTILNHLSDYVATGEIDIKELVPEEKLKQITEYFRQNPESSLRDAKDALPETVDWGDLKMVRAYLGEFGE